MDKHSNTTQVKEAGALSTGGPYRTQHQDKAKYLLAKQLMALLGVGAMGGFGLRGARSLFNRTGDVPPTYGPQLPQPLHIPNPEPPRIEEGEDLQKAADWTESLTNSVGKGLGAVSDTLNSAYDSTAGAVSKVLPQTFTKDPVAGEYALPLAATALIGGGYGGYKLLDWILNKQKQQQQQDELDETQQQFNDALSQQYQAAMQSKQAEDDLGLDDLADRYEKQAVNPMAYTPTLSAMQYWPGGSLVDSAWSKFLGHDAWQGVKGGTNTALGALALGAGLLAYNRTRQSNKQELIAKALKKRRAQRKALSPPPLVAMPDQQNEE